MNRQESGEQLNLEAEGEGLALRAQLAAKEAEVATLVVDLQKATKASAEEEGRRLKRESELEVALTSYQEYEIEGVECSRHVRGGGGAGLRATFAARSVHTRDVLRVRVVVVHVRCCACLRARLGRCTRSTRSRGPS